MGDIYRTIKLAERLKCSNGYQAHNIQNAGQNFHLKQLMNKGALEFNTGETKSRENKWDNRQEVKSLNAHNNIFSIKSAA